YGFLVKLLTESLFFRLPKPQVSMRMSDLIDPMFFCEKLSRRAQPGSFRLSFSCPATESANHPRMKGAISFPVEEPTRVITLGKQDLSDKRHVASLSHPRFVLLFQRHDLHWVGMHNQRLLNSGVILGHLRQTPSDGGLALGLDLLGREMNVEEIRKFN